MLLKRLLPYAAIFLLSQTLLRLSILMRAILDVEFDTSSVTALLARGFWFDCVTASFFLLPIALYHLALPTQKQGERTDQITDKILRLLFAFIVLFDAVAEHLFWSEFTTRFNFIAVDYLIYTQEVIGNIMESYPLYWLLFAIAVGATFITWISLRLQPLPMGEKPSFKRRARAAAVLAAGCALLYSASSIEQSQIKDNAEASELAANGIYNLFSAFWSNEISYTRFYSTKPDADIQKNARNLLWEKESTFVHDDGKDLTRLIQAKGKEQRKNVILVVMESLSADYMGTFGNKDGLTPNLDRLAKEGIFFSNLYATGTRTVRGLEAVTLSIPPTPGQSIIRRPGNENLFSLGFIFKDRGYDTKFIYGGYGYFDNMNSFFAGNGFDILDRTSMARDEISFANVWGVCDEDMFTRAIKEGDRSYANGKPFMHLIMTTSNHRPFTYPDGRIDISSHSGRLGGVKYADYSVGKLIEDAKHKPWFNNTVFVFVSDHTAGAGGKAELDPHKYHIPMIFYSPSSIKPKRYEKIASQIDMAPVLLGLLNFSYYTKFFGEDLLNDDDEIPHAFISNYQKIALAKEDGLTVLAPKRQVEQYSWPDIISRESANDPEIENTITYYQSASWWKEQYKRIPTVAKPR
ncbi:MAG: sulfatase-like hydrolase/transferase [Rickettsiales bacterium]|nr:sulfatase-like hydrolase/transferase [Rickettsiales bacterium]